ncbi:MAG: sialidase family protein, partial [Acidimicrobiia bacterium]
FSAPVVVAGQDVEEVLTSMDMATLFVAPDGDVYVSFLDARENIEDRMKAKPAAEHEGHDMESGPGPENQLRVVRSTDGGATWARSVLVARATCVCCGTMIAQGADGPLYAGTRSEWKELKDSKDAVRDPYLSASTDDGATWGAAVKIHDDKFKVSGCPDVASGLAVDSGGRLHAAWYTGTDSHPGVYYAVSDDEGKTFSAPIALLRDEWIPYGDVKLAVDGEDHAWVAFEDRRSEFDQVRVVRIDPAGKVSFSKTWPGTIPSISTGEDWAAVAWQAVERDEAKPTSLSLRVARPGK